MKYDSAFQREGGGEYGHLHKHTHKSRRSALPPSQAYAPSSRRLTADLLPSMSAPALSHLPLLNGLCTALRTHPKISQNFQSLIVLKISWSCTADTRNSPFRARGGGLDTSSPYHISGVDVGAEGEEDEDFLENAPSGGFDELPRRLALGARD